jgi:hypothetical protein
MAEAAAAVDWAAEEEREKECEDPSAMWRVAVAMLMGNRTPAAMLAGDHGDQVVAYGPGSD